MFSFEMPVETMRAYAAARSLAFTEQGLLPPSSSVLREGLGAGERRASIITAETARGYTARGGLKKYPERATWSLCSGVLPGGLDGALGHHQHLELRSGGSDGGQSWYVATDTVVVARLPERSRAVCELRVAPGETAAALTPAEDQATYDAIMSTAVATELAQAPRGTRVELVDGALCVSAPGIVSDAEALDTLCAVAAGIAAGVRAVVARHGELDAATGLPAPPATPRQAWLDEGIARVDWSAGPPASVLDARAAYEGVVAQGASGSGHRARWLVLALGLFGSFLWFGIAFFFVDLFEDRLWAVCVATGGALIGVWKTIRAAFEAGEEVRADAVLSQAGPWGVEAFARGYARARGLTLEDPDALRHRLAAPIGGKPMRAMHGDLGGGVRGHVALWRDWVAETHWLIAAVPAPAGGVAAAPPYQASVAGGVLVVGRQVSEAERSAGALDALLAEARRLAAPSVAAATTAA